MFVIIRALATLSKHRALIWQLAKHKLREQYAGTLLGSFWAILQPMISLLVFWFVFTYGFKPQALSVTEFPFFLVLFCGLIPWMAFSESLSGGTNAILSHQYLVKKIVFPLEILPFVQIVASVVVHVYMIVFLLLILFIYGIWSGMYLIQVVYYTFAMVFFTMGLTWALSALNVFHRDVGQSLIFVLTLWFWMTPIVWPAKNVTGWMLRLIQANPMYYIIEGYRKTFLYAEPFWANFNLGIYFWIVSIILFIVGFSFFNRVKSQFCDVL
jgi:teichoic acid transport system permease protein